MMRMSPGIATVLLVAAYATAGAQTTAGNGAVALAGRVASGGRPVGGAFVSARREGSALRVTVTTDANGRYAFPALARGTYRIEVHGGGVERWAHDSVPVGARTRPLEFNVRPAAGVALADRTSSDFLSLLPDGEEKRRFTLDCTGCHQLDAKTVAPAGLARTQDQWREAVARMLGYAGATSGFPVISAYRAPEPTAVWLARYLGDSALRRLGAPTRQARRTLPARRAVITEYEMPVAQDLPHDIALDSRGHAIITGMFTHQLYDLDPSTGELSTVSIPVPDANPRALEIAADGTYWVLLGNPRKIARRDPSGGWSSYDIGMYPHSIGADQRGRVWFNGHFTRDPEQIGYLDSKSGEVKLFNVPPHPSLAAVPGGPIPYELRVAPDGRVWISELGGDRLIRFAPETGAFAVHVMPLPHSGPRRFDVDRSGAVWIPEYSGNVLARLDPAGRFDRFELPLKDAVPYVVRVDNERRAVWIGTSAADAMLRFDLATRRFDVYPLPSRGALVRHLAIDSTTGVVWAAYGASPGIAARVARIELEP